MITYIDSAKLPTPFGIFDIHGFASDDGKEHIALTYGSLDNSPILGRIHSECLTGDALFSLRCDCGFQLEAAMKAIVKEGKGFILYLQQEGRGIGLLNKIKAYHLQDDGANTVEANNKLGFADDLREYSMLLPMLNKLGIEKVKLMTNNPRKVKAMQDIGMNVIERVPLEVGKNKYNIGYLQTKSSKLGHLLSSEFIKS